MASIRLLLVLSIVFICIVQPISTSPFPSEALPTKSGYLRVNTTTNSSLFYAFYEAQQASNNFSHTPLLIWFQGGPGCSSMFGNFFELGPYLVLPDQPTLRPNPYSWNRVFGLLFIDNPIGTGFSVAVSSDEIPRDQPTVAAHIYNALQLFLYENPSFRSRPMYITGESYAGKYVPAAGYHILKQNSRAPKSKRINLGGVAIGNGLTHPITQVATHAANAYFSGLINDKQRNRMEELQTNALKLVEEERWSEATDARNQVLRYLKNVTGLATLYNLSKKKPYISEMVGVFLNKNEVKAALGVDKGIIWEECSDVVAKALHEDVMKSVKFKVEELVKKSRVLLYQGQFDLRDGVVSTEAWMKKLEWEGLKSFLNAERKVWNIDGELAGYVQRWGSLSHVVVSGAGHMVPTDQGLSSQVMVENWVLEEGLFSRDTLSKERSFRRSY